MKEKITVYSYRRCPFAMRVRMTLHEKDIPFEVKEEDLGNFSEELKNIHPEVKVPVLVHGKILLYESVIITEYIEDAFPESVRLMPIEASLRAEVRLWSYWCNHIFKPTLDRFKYGKSRFPEQECIGIEERVKNQLSKLEVKLKESSWLVGGKFSLADIHLFPFVRQLSKVTPKPDFFSNYPKVINWLSEIANRKSFIKTIEKLDK